MSLSPIDAATAVLIFFVYINSRMRMEDFHNLGTKREFLDKQKDDGLTQNQWNDERELEYKISRDNITRKLLQFWLGPNSFVASICFSIAGVALGFTSFPGFIVGVSISSPRLQGLIAASLGIVVRLFR